MKKFIGCALLIAVLVGAVAMPALGESFSLHGEVTFDMTVDEMMQAETAAGFTPALIHPDNQGSRGYISIAGLDADNDVGSFDLSAYSSVYEIQGSFVDEIFNRLYYFFDGNGQLCQMLYTTSKHGDAQPVAKIIHALANMLTNKYNAPYEGELLDVQNTFEIRDAFVSRTRDTSKTFGIDLIVPTDASYQWFVPFGEGAMTEVEIMPIQLVHKSFLSSDTYTKNEGYTYLLGYTRISAADYEGTIAAIEQQTQAEEAQQQEKAAQAYDDL